MNQVEKKWQRIWKKENIYKSSNSRADKFYILVELAYSSGDLHIGHWFGWTAPDVYARFQRMQGKNVLFPVGGFDSFGLPAENAAIKRGVDPETWTNTNINTMRKQFESLGPSFDWDCEVVTSSPEYYKWTQWLFLKLYEHGLVYRTKAYANWCPECKTVLANEHVENGCCWRHPDTPVIQKKVNQWFVKITDYADRLIWPEKTKVDWPKEHIIGQNNWIGKKEGVLIKFKKENGGEIEVFTTRPETLNAATFIAIADEKLYGSGANDKNKIGVFTGEYAINPLNGRKMPIWKANYVAADYGTGAVMGVPAHDERDMEFANKYNIDIVDLKPEKNNFGVKHVSYHLRDWSVSRHRYWGAPVPIIYCDKCGTVPVPYEDLPVVLPKNVDYTPRGKPPLATASEWLRVLCPKCNGPAEREAETLDTFVDSSWYFLRYPDSKNNVEPFDKKIINEWLPIKVYFGGREHVHGHTLYARFITKFLHDLGYLNFDEFAQKRINHGIVLGPDGQKMSKSRGNVVNPDAEVGKYGADAVRMYLCFMGPHEQAAPWKREGVEGMSRFIKRLWKLLSEYNDYVVVSESDSRELIVKVHKAIKKVTKDIEEFHFNTPIAVIMELVNKMYEIINKKNVKRAEKGVRCAEWDFAIETLTKLVAPFAPHIAEEVWRVVLGKKESVHVSEWPKYKEELVLDEEVDIAVQVNGKFRALIRVCSEDIYNRNLIESKAKEVVVVKKWIEGKNYKVVFVSGKLINFVTI